MHASERQTVLVVDDAPDNIDVLTGALWERFRVRAALSGERALVIAGTDPRPDLILLDIMMPAMDGYEVLRRLKADPASAAIPVIFVTALGDHADEQLGLELGAVDYITKPISPAVVRARVTAHLALHHQKRELARLVCERTATLRDRETRLRKLSRAVEQNPNMIVITDLNGTIEYVNPSFCRLTGYAAEEAIGRTPRLLKSDETPAELFPVMWRTILSGHEWRGEIKDRAKDGRTFWSSLIISPVRDEEGAITNFVSMHETITERKAAEDATRRAKELAELASRAKSEFLTTMSHELRTPLNAVIGFSELLLTGAFGTAPNPKFEEYITYIHDSGQHLLCIINDILDVSAIDAGRVDLHEKMLGIRDVVEASIRLVAARAEAAMVTLVDQVPGDLPRLRADERRLKQMLLNLLSNAVKFTPRQGTVTISAGVNAAGGMDLTVTDSGIGMDPAGIAKALTPFGQVDSGLSRAQEGTGLGLPLTVGLVRLHGGTLAIASAPGAGTTVTITLPAERIEGRFP